MEQVALCNLGLFIKINKLKEIKQQQQNPMKTLESIETKNRPNIDLE